MKKALVFANGSPEHGVMVSRTLAEAESAIIIAADGGASIAKHFGLVPDVIIGDMDSLTSSDLSDYTEAEIHRFPAEKDETDLELALLHTLYYGAKWIRVIGALGGRFDQMLANIYLLTLPELNECDLAIVAGKQMIRLLRPGSHELAGSAGDTLSLIPLSTEVAGITSQHLKYPLQEESLYLGPTRGISNVMEHERIHITFRQGLLLTIHTVGRA